MLLNGYGKSNQINSLTGRYKTYIGPKIIIAPEKLETKDYNKKYDLSIFVDNIYQIYTKKPL